MPGEGVTPQEVKVAWAPSRVPVIQHCSPTPLFQLVFNGQQGALYLMRVSPASCWNA